MESLAVLGLYLKPEKCDFHKEEVIYMEIIIGRGGVKMDPKKVVAVQDLPVPQEFFNILSFTRFVNFYRDFIEY